MARFAIAILTKDDAMVVHSGDNERAVSTAHVLELIRESWNGGNEIFVSLYGEDVVWPVRINPASVVGVTDLTNA